jgi:hypothetical protein
VLRGGALVAPEVVWPGVLEPGVVVVPGAVALEVVVGGMVVLPGTAVVGAATAAGAVVTVVVAGAAVVEVLEPPASVTSAAASTPSDSAARTASTRTGAFQAGDAARRVRAAAPQRRHHSCSGSSGAPHSGHISRVGSASAVVAPGVGVATLTRPGREDGRSQWVGPARTPARALTRRLSGGRSMLLEGQQGLQVWWERVRAGLTRR